MNLSCAKFFQNRLPTQFARKDHDSPIFMVRQRLKEKLAMRPILSATSTYNFALARWLDDKLKPLSINSYTISDTFSFADEIRNLSLNETDILVSYDVSSLFTNVPLQETIEILPDRTFVDNWFNKTHHLNIIKLNERGEQSCWKT